MKNSRKGLKKKTKGNFFTISYKCQLISTKIGVIGHGTFFKQCLKFDIVFLNIFYGTKGIVFHKGGDTKPIIMKQLQVQEKSP
jgi:hypothetical protein